MSLQQAYESVRQYLLVTWLTNNHRKVNPGYRTRSPKLRYYQEGYRRNFSIVNSESFLAQNQQEEAIASKEAAATKSDMTTFTSIPDEIVCNIFSFLDVPSLAAVARVCSLWSRLSSQDAIWSQFFLPLFFPYDSRIPQSKLILCFVYEVLFIIENHAQSMMRRLL